MKKLLVLCVILTMWMFGCGSETTGTLSVSAPTSTTKDIVTAKAKYTPSSGSALPNQIISFRWYTVGATSKTQSAELTTSGRTDSSGTVSSQLTLPAVRTESYYVYVIASTADLTNIEGWQSVLVAP